MCSLMQSSYEIPISFATEAGTSMLDPMDRISELPEEIGLTILSFLGMKEAAKTSVLSKRWRYTWTYLPDLDFDDSMSPNWVDNNPDSDLAIEIHKYVDWVNRVVLAHRAPVVKKFRVYFYLNGTHASDIDRWVNFCLRKGVQELEVNCSGNIGTCHDEYYTFGSMWEALLPRDTHLIPTFTNLKSFCVESLKISGRMIELMLSTCPLLEELCVRWCVGLGSLKVVGSSLKLKYLEIDACEVDKVEVSAAELVSLVCCSHEIELLCNSVPSVVDAHFGGHSVKELISQFSPWSCQLEKLSLTPPASDFCPPSFPPFAKLKQLKLSISATYGEKLHIWTYFIDACPLLREFKLEVDWLGKSRSARATGQLVKATNKVHLRLEYVHLVGFVGRKTDAEFASYLVKIAPFLKRFTFDPRNPFLIGEANPCGNSDKANIARQRAKELSQHFPPAIDVVII